MEFLVVPWTPGPLIRIHAADGLQRPTGLPIDPSDPDVAALVDAYEALLATEPGDLAVGEAHRGVLRTASLLRFARPAGPAEREYVRRRTRAIVELLDKVSDTTLAYLRHALDRR
jgi:hypothetical protein